MLASYQGIDSNILYCTSHLIHVLELLRHPLDPNLTPIETGRWLRLTPMHRSSQDFIYYYIVAFSRSPPCAHWRIGYNVVISAHRLNSAIVPRFWNLYVSYSTTSSWHTLATVTGHMYSIYYYDRLHIILLPCHNDNIMSLPPCCTSNGNLSLC